MSIISVHGEPVFVLWQIFVFFASLINLQTEQAVAPVFMPEVSASEMAALVEATDMLLQVISGSHFLVVSKLIISLTSCVGTLRARVVLLLPNPLVSHHVQPPIGEKALDLSACQREWKERLREWELEFARLNNGRVPSNSDKEQVRGWYVQYQRVRRCAREARWSAVGRSGSGSDAQ